MYQSNQLYNQDRYTFTSDRQKKNRKKKVVYILKKRMFELKFILKISIIIILCFVYQKYYPDFENAIKQKDFFIENKQNKPILSKINRELLKSLSELDNDSTKLQNWFDDLNKNNIVVLDDNKYYFYVYEKISSSESSMYPSFQLKVHNSAKFLNMMWEDLYEYQENNFVFVREKTNKDLLYNMYSSATVNDKSVEHPTIIRYYWTDPINNKLTLKEAVIHKWHTKDGRTGIIGMGYTVKELSDKIKIQYKDFINFHSLLSYLVVTGLVTILLLSRNTIMALIFFFLALFGFKTYVENAEFIGSTSSENTKTESMNSKILSISFLLGVNIFILNTLDKKYSIKTFSDTAVIFSFSLILILFNIFDDPSSSNVTHIMRERISKQLIFNLSVILNIFIIFTYFVHIINTKKIWNRFIPNY